MLSRVANNLFWLGRYMERSYGILLTLKIGYSESQDFLNIDDKEDTITENYIDTVHKALYDVSNSNSIYNLIYKSREGARSSQEQISRELWLCINKYYLYLRNNKANETFFEDPIDTLEEIMNLNLLYYGISDMTQERGSSSSFINCGKYIERIFRSITFFEKKFLKSDLELSNSLEDSIHWKNLLLSIGGYQLYLRTYKSVFELDHIMELLISNPYFPHSLYYSIKKLETHISRLKTNNTSDNQELIFLMGKLESKIKYTTVDNVKKIGLQNFIKSVQSDIFEISTSFNHYYFSNF